MKGTEGSKTLRKHKADLYKNSWFTRQVTDVKWKTKQWLFTWV